MREFTESLWFVVSFLFVTALLRVFAGERITVWFLTLVLVGMVLANANKFAQLLNTITSKEG